MNGEEIKKFLDKRGFLVDNVVSGYIVYLKDKTVEAIELFKTLPEGVNVHFEQSDREYVQEFHNRMITLDEKVDEAKRDIDEKIKLSNHIITSDIENTTSKFKEEIAKVQKDYQSKLDKGSIKFQQSEEAMDEVWNEICELIDVNTKKPNWLQRLFHADKQSTDSTN